MEDQQEEVFNCCVQILGDSINLHGLTFGKRYKIALRYIDIDDQLLQG